MIGGNGPRRTLPLAARYADEWNAVFVTADRFAELNARLDDLLDEVGRPREAVRRTLMTRVLFGRDQAELRGKLDGESVAEARAGGMLVGDADEVVAQLQELAAVGVRRVMLQWLELDDIAALDDMAHSVLSRV